MGKHHHGKRHDPLQVQILRLWPSATEGSSVKQLFEMTEAQRDRIMAASKPTPVMYLSGGQPMYDTPQENANAAWRAVAAELGFVWDSVEPATGKSDRFFMAEPA